MRRMALDGVKMIPGTEYEGLNVVIRGEEMYWGG